MIDDKAEKYRKASVAKTPMITSILLDPFLQLTTVKSFSTYLDITVIFIIVYIKIFHIVIIRYMKPQITPRHTIFYKIEHIKKYPWLVICLYCDTYIVLISIFIPKS
jgi:hypothetical protein